MKFAGLTNDPETKRIEHGNPFDWNQHRFYGEEEAKSWEKLMVEIGYQGGVDCAGWKYGYTYTITKKTIQ